MGKVNYYQRNKKKMSLMEIYLLANIDLSHIDKTGPGNKTTTVVVSRKNKTLLIFYSVLSSNVQCLEKKFYRSS